MLRFFYFLLLVLQFFYFSSLKAAESDWGGIEEAKVRIVSSLSKVGENKTFYAGLEYQLKDGWKTYWHTPGEGGYPQTLDWSQSSNLSTLEILWPEPKEFEILGLKSLGYEKEVIFPLKIELNDINKPAFFLFELNYLTCKDICLPGKAYLELNLPTGKGEFTKHSFKIEKYLSIIPTKKQNISRLKILKVSANKNKSNLDIFIKAESIVPLKNPKFFLGNKIGLPVITPQYNFSSNRKNISVNFFYENFKYEKKDLDLSIFFSDNNFSIEEEIKVLINNNLKYFKIDNKLLYILLIAILGGLILNIMPCVLPVLSIKLISVLQTRQKNDSYLIRKSFFVTAFGIISSFLLISVVLILLKMGGNSIGWGMQFQQPLFVMLISLILFLFSLNLIGIFEFQVPRFIFNLFKFSNHKSIFYGDFFNGFFATLLATPCSAPFVGTAISAAFTQSYKNMIFIFFFMGFGMSIPYILAGIFPKIVFLLPKPGSWINFIKYVLSFLLLGTIFWLFLILQNHFNYIFIIISILLYLVIFLSYKFLNKFKYYLISFSVLFFLSLSFIPQLKLNNVKTDSNWLDISQVSINELINENNIIFVDITADWCATCQFNKLNVIQSTLIQNIFKEYNVIKIRGDWTKPNEEIEKYLNSFSRFGIPFNVIYGKNYSNGIVLSEFLTSSEIIKAIELIKKTNDKKNT